MKRTFWGVVLAASVMSLVVPSAFGAESVSFSVSQGMPTPLSAGASGNFNLPKFNPGLGDLLKVTIEVTGNSYGGTHTLDSESAFSGSAEVRIGSQVELTGPENFLLIQPVATNAGPVAADNESGPPDPINNDPDWIGTDSIMVQAADIAHNEVVMLVDPGDDLSGYIGPGNLAFSFSSAVNSLSTASVAPAYTKTEAPTFDFTVTVTYEYIPEPGMALLFLGGLGGLLMRRRTRR